MKTKTSLLFFLIINSAVFGQSLEVKFQNTIDSIHTTNPESVGIMVHVESPDQDISWSGAVGYSNKTLQTRVDPEQPALIASCTKTYVSAAILRLVEDKVIEIDQSINNILTEGTRKLFESDGYNLDSITISHLLSHTSGIADFVSDEYFSMVIGNPKYRWTRNEQLEFAIEVGDPIAKPGNVYSYADANYLLLSEIIEKLTGSPFYISMRKLLRYKSLMLNNTWFYTLEEKPKTAKPLVYQYWGDYNSYNIDVSSDLYGGGGIACTTKDLACFSYNLFNAKIIEDTTALNLIFTESISADSIQNNYHLGLMKYSYRGLTAYGHPGFWGTDVLYIPELNSSISVYVLEKNRRELIQDVIHNIIGILLQ